MQQISLVLSVAMSVSDLLLHINVFCTVNDNALCFTQGNKHMSNKLDKDKNRQVACFGLSHKVSPRSVMYTIMRYAFIF